MAPERRLRLIGEKGLDERVKVVEQLHYLLLLPPRVVSKLLWIVVIEGMRLPGPKPGMGFPLRDFGDLGI